jgi:hypothetical protein
MMVILCEAESWRNRAGRRDSRLSKERESLEDERAQLGAHAAGSAVMCSRASEIAKRRALQGAASLLDCFCNCKNQLVFKGAPDDLHADG